MGSSVRKILKEKENKKKGVKPAFLFLFISYFILLAWYFLYVRNADTMYFLQDRGWWNSTNLFWNECTRLPGGFLSWAGAYMTQFFYYPALGSSMFIGLLIATFWLAKWSFKIPGEWSFLLFIPMAALLCSDIQLGYWVYFLKDIDYVFYHPLGLFFSIILSLPFWQYLPLSEKVQDRIAFAWIPLVAALFYYPFGIYALLAASLVTMQTLSKSSGLSRPPLNGEKNKSSFLLALKARHGAKASKNGDFEVVKASSLRGSCPLVAEQLGSVSDGGPKGLVVFFILLPTLWLVPLLETSGTTLMRPDQPWLYGLQKFEFDDLRDYSLEIPFYIALIVPLFFPFIKKIKIKELIISQGLMVVTACLLFWYLSAFDFKDYNFHAEMRMQRGVEECRWNDVLREAALAKGPVSREMVMFRDIALINRGELCSKRYAYNNESLPPATASDSMLVRIANQAADLIYYNYGETVFGIRRAIERCMHYGYSYYTMRLLTQCAIVNGELDNARRYLRLMSRTTFQKKWAREMQRFVDDERLLLTDDHFRMPLKLYNEGSELVGVDDSYVELTIMKKWMYCLTNDPEAQEVALGCAMMMRDRKCFWSQVQQYYNINPERHFPIHVQEAMLFEVYELGMQGVNLSFVQFDQRVVDRFNAFRERKSQYASSGMDERQIGAALRPEFGDTYYWDYFVLREVQTN